MKASTPTLKKIGAGLVIVAALVVFGFRVKHSSAVGDIGYLQGRVFFDDDGSTLKDKPTDSNGVEDTSAGEIGWSGSVTILDGQSYQVAWADPWGNWHATVSTLAPVSVTYRTPDPNLPLNFIATTPLTYTVSVPAGATVTIPSFGSGPRE